MSAGFSPDMCLSARDTRAYREPRYQVIGELLGEVFLVVYTRTGYACRLVTAWIAEPYEPDLWDDIAT